MAFKTSETKTQIATLLERIDLPDAMELDELLDQLLRCHRGAGREWKAPRSLPTACLST